MNFIFIFKIEYFFLDFILDASSDEYTTVLIQGSGSYAVEATFSTSVPRQGAKVVDFLFYFKDFNDLFSRF